MANLIGKMAPDFTAAAVLGNNSIEENFTLKTYLNKSIGFLFFYPMDFTFVCPSEILAFNNRLEEFNKRNAKLVGISTDTHFTHLAWKKTPVNQGGIGQIQFPLIADISKAITQSYDVLTKDFVAFRASFLIDQEGIVRHQILNDLPFGRNIDEALRMIDALLFHQQHGEVCPAGWNKGQSGMKATAEGVASYLAQNEKRL